MSEAAEPFAGKRLSVRDYAITEGMLADYHEGLRLEPHEHGLAPSMVAADSENGYFSEIAFPYHVGHLWMRQELECFRPAAPGVPYRTKGRVQRIYDHRDRKVVEYVVELLNAQDELMARTCHHQSFLVEAPERGQVAFRDPNKKPGARRFEVPRGDAFGGLEREITLEMCGVYFHGDANYHTDLAKSQELGFRDVVVGGRMTLAYATHILEERFGEEWWKSGAYVAKFTNPVWPGDRIVARGVDVGRRASRHAAFAWLEKADGTVVLVMDASVNETLPRVLWT